MNCMTGDFAETGRHTPAVSNQRVAQRAANKGGRGARQRILDAAAELYYREGINATGVERSGGRTNGSTTLYQHFPSKTAVVKVTAVSSATPRAIRADTAGLKRCASDCCRFTLRGAALLRAVSDNGGRRDGRTMPGVQETVRNIQIRPPTTSWSWPNRRAQPIHDN